MRIYCFSIILVIAVSVVACKKSNTSPSITPTPSDRTTPASGTVSIGPCTSSTSCPGFDPSIFILVEARDGGPCDTAFACRGEPCAACAWTYTFLNQTISGAGQKETQFVFQSNQQGNYEAAVQMPAGLSSFQLKLRGRGTQGGLYVRSVTLIEAPNWQVACTEPQPVNVSFWKPAGTPAQTARFLINARAEQDGQPRCEL